MRASGDSNSASTPYGRTSSMGLLLLLAMQDLLGLENRDDREQPNDEKKWHREQADGAEIRRPIPKCGRVRAPRGDKKIAIETGYQDHVALQPHADCDAEPDQKERPRRSPHASPPQRLQKHEVENDGAPICPGIGAEKTVAQCLQLVRVT